jgi:hypothetical protein
MLGTGADLLLDAGGPQADAYDALTVVQRRLLWAPPAHAREEYDGAPAPFRQAFEAVTTRLSSLILSDPENGEVLGSAVELVDRVEQPAVQAVATGLEMRLVVTLASGARDVLRRAREFTRVDGADGAIAFVHEGPAAIRFEISGRLPNATVIVQRP